MRGRALGFGNGGSSIEFWEWGGAIGFENGEVRSSFGMGRCDRAAPLRNRVLGMVEVRSCFGNGVVRSSLGMRCDRVLGMGWCDLVFRNGVVRVRSVPLASSLGMARWD
ncbi:hypothetical protein CSQ80_08770 [Cyanobacterium aponinum IPPAS B-1201]|nr:hypothetical protein CSQ80_08770 [Cyanobacterium aponinum IPPAS B-1201]